jgi:hypothetical protein
MSTSPSAAPSPLISKQEYYSSLPWFRRWLAMLNWRPVVDYELREIEFDQREIEFKRREIEFEKRKIAHEQRMKQLESEIAQLDELNSKLDVLLFSSSTSLTPAPNTPDNSKA